MRHAGLCLMLGMLSLPNADACSIVSGEMARLMAEADRRLPPPPTRPLPIPVLTQAQRAAALSRMPQGQQSQVVEITPTLRHYGFGAQDVESMRVACDISFYGCTIYGATLHLKPVRLTEGICMRARRWVSLDRADLPVVPLSDMSPALAKTAGLQVTLRVGSQCEDWPEGVEGIRFPLHYDPGEPAAVLEWLRTQQLSIRTGQRPALQIRHHGTDKFARSTDPMELFAQADLNSIAYMSLFPESQANGGQDAPRTWKFALEFPFPGQAEPLRPVILQLPSTGRPELEIHPSPPGCP